MKNDYDKFFKSAQNAKKQSKINIPRTRSKSVPKQDSETAEEFLRLALKVKPKSSVRKKFSFPFGALIVLMLCSGGAGFLYYDRSALHMVLDGLEINFIAPSLAQNSSGGGEKNAATEGGATAENSEGSKGAGKSNCTEVKGFTEEELSHFNKLNERKKQLDQREQELSLLEEELHKQKAEIEVRISKLEQIRDEVGSVLKERVEVDQQRVSTLVDFYSNMKPKQAADIVAKLNETLAVEILSKMKKKNAADILNLLEPAKARVLSEKFTGYTRQ